jgi:nucleotide-binding universal stress UspA family protein
MTPHILAGVDFSDGAFAALLEAQELARRMRLELRVMHVRERGPEDRDTDTMSRWLAAAGMTCQGLRLRLGQPWIELAREAGESGTGVLVVGSHGRSGVQPVRLGSTAARLGLIAPCPLVVVGPRAAGPAQSRTRRPRPDAWHSTPSGE